MSDRTPAMLRSLDRDQLRRWLPVATLDRKSTRLNSSHLVISYAVFCLKKKKEAQTDDHHADGFSSSSLDPCLSLRLSRPRSTARSLGCMAYYYNQRQPHSLPSRHHTLC